MLDLGVGQANLHICWPYSMLEPVRDLLYSTMQSDQMTHDSRWTRNLARRLVEAEVTLNAVLGHGRLTLGDLVDLRVGDVIPIEIPELVTVYSDGVPVIRGHYGTRNKHYAVKIHHFVAEEEPPDDPPNGAPQEVDETAESTEE
ncbi:MAG TPA: hypothetical protein DIT50_00035 [Rhodocyclaceae bacterium]|nr:hypothetical protein [Rhodocyclaceae bacterium]